MRYKESLKLDNETNENTQDMLDENVIEILNGSEAYAKIDHIREATKEKQLIEKHASDITNELKQKA